MASETDGRGDFDFLFGRWTVRNQRLLRRLQGCTEWMEFEATQEAGPVLGGIGNVDHYFVARHWADGRPFHGMTVRLFDPAAQQWSIYWADSRGGQLQPPVVGRFENGHGVFFGDDTFDGKPIRVRFDWRVTGTMTASWEQAFSPDGGKTWETNWRMLFTRLP
ncbi:hypothetical protein ACLESO_42770 [Pyxidicoccus sp. 3LG]